MPPFVPRKRSHSPAPSEPPRKRIASAQHKPAPKRKPSPRPKKSVFAEIDNPSSRGRTVEDNKAFLEGLAQEQSDFDSAEDDDSSDSDEFEDVLHQAGTSKVTTASHDIEDCNSDEDKDETASNGSATWRDLLPPVKDNGSTAGPAPSGDLQITLPHANEVIDYSQWASARETTGKKGPSKIERQIRVATHCMHVQFLLFHNLLRNSWAQDKEVKKILLGKLSEGCWKEIARWREAEGLPQFEDDEIATQPRASGSSKAEKAPENLSRTNGPSKGKAKAKAKGHDGKLDIRSHRDWSHTAAREPGNPAHDPLPRLLTYLASFWKKTFKATAPSLHKTGYLEPAALQSHMRAFRKDKNDVDRFGERINSLKAFRRCAQEGSGSRDVGQQLFTGLLRAIGIEARMVCSLQPIGFGWSKGEEGKLKKSSSPKNTNNDEVDNDTKNFDSMDLDHNEQADDSLVRDGGSTKKPAKVTFKSRASKLSTRNSHQGSKVTPINIDSESSELSDPPTDSDSDLSIVDLTPSKPKPAATKGYSQTHPFPTYWTEAFSPTTHLPHAASPLTSPHIASSAEGFQSFEPRGKDAEKAKQVFAYVVAYASDGTAKDVTVRYLKRRMWPGKTKGVRMPIEKVPIHNKRGKVKRYEEYDWFKSVLSAYTRDSRRRNNGDEIEDTGDLVPVKPSKKEVSENLDTLSGLKASAEYVLERFLRREEALLPEAKPLRNFTSGKGDKAKTEPVYRRKDIVACKTVESWHKEGRELLPGQQPLKRVPHRAVTLIRKQEIADQERETGEKPLQGLYSKAQTQWIIPPPIENGHIPRNAFGNIDVYVPSMVPQGAVHLPLRGTVKVCKKLGIDFAEACVGFEFGAQRAVPVLHGVVVAEENKNLVRDAWRAAQEAQRQKEESKREAVALGLWRKFFLGMKIIERVRKEYGDLVGDAESDLNPFVNKKAREIEAQKRKQQDHRMKPAADDAEMGGEFLEQDEDMAGGVFLPGHIEEEVALPKKLSNPRAIVPELLGEDEGGGFILEQEDNRQSASPELAKQSEKLRTPISLQSAYQNLIASASAETLGICEDQHTQDTLSQGEDKNKKASSVPNPTHSNSSPRSQRGRKKKSGGRTPVPGTLPSKISAQPGMRKKQFDSEEEADDVQKSSSSESGYSRLSPSFAEAGEDAEFNARTVSPRKAKGRVAKAMRVINTKRDRNVPARRSARKSTAKSDGVRSKYFEASGSDDELDD